MKSINKTKGWLVALLVSAGTMVTGQTVVISGERTVETLFTHWVNEYKKVNPTFDASYTHGALAADLKVEFVSGKQEEKGKDQFSVAQTVLLPIGNVGSQIVAKYGEKGLNNRDIKTLYFDDPFSELKPNADLEFEVYSRLGDTGVPVIFAQKFGFGTELFRGKVIAGNDQHVLMATARDVNGISYAPLHLIYDLKSRRPVTNVAVLPVDLDGNGRVTDAERVYADIDQVLEGIKSVVETEPENLATITVKVSVAEGAPKNTLQFVRWIMEEGQTYLYQFGFLNPESQIIEKSLVRLERAVMP